MGKNKFVLITIAVIIAIVGIIAFGGFFGGNQKDEDQNNAKDLGIPTEVAKVEKGDLIKGIEYIGTIEPKNSVVLSPKITSQVVGLNIEEGDIVKKGEVIAKLDDSQLAAGLDTTSAKIETLEVNYRYLNEQIKKYETSNPLVKKIETLETNYAYLSEEEEKYRTLYEQGGISKNAYDKIKHEKDMVGMQLQEVKASSQDAYAQLKNQRDTSEAQLKELRTKVGELNINIGETNIVAPISGRIRMVNYQTGDLAMMGKPFAVIDGNEGQIAKMKVSEQDLEKIGVGTKAVLNITGVKSVLEAKVTKIMPSVNANTRVGEVEVQIQNAQATENIAFGTSVAAKFIIDEAKEQIVISRTAIKELQDKEFVYIIENGVAREQEIKTGLVVGDSVAVTEGLQIGEKIAMKNLTRIYDKAKVYIAKGDKTQ